MYKLTITTASIECGQKHIITCTFISRCDTMMAAMEKATRYAFIQMHEENCDYIESIKVVRMEDEDA